MEVPAPGLHLAVPIDAGQHARSAVADMTLIQARDFRDECDALHAVLATAPPAAWQQPTQFKRWTFDDIAQCFAGPREAPPPPGTRYCQNSDAI